MRLSATISIYGGGPGSGCNPEVGKCGRPKLSESEQQQLQGHLKDWSLGGQAFQVLKQEAQEAIASGNPDSNLLVKAIREQTYDFDTHRGLTLQKNDPLLQAKVGQEVSLYPQSFSTNRAVAKKFLFDAGAPKSGKVWAIVTVEGPTHGVRTNVEKFQTMETEVISGGKYKVLATSVEKNPSTKLGPVKYHIIKLKQTDVF